MKMIKPLMLNLADIKKAIQLIADRVDKIEFEQNSEMSDSLSYEVEKLLKNESS